MNIGDRLGSNWRVVRALGTGGMGSVYACEHVSSPSITAAVKVLDPAWSRHAIARDRFLREAEVLYQIQHPSVVRLRNVDLDADPPYLEMDLVVGESLEDVLQRGPLQAGRVRAVADQLLDALAYMHRRGVWHRDVKPANVVLGADGMATLVDFGLAKKVGQHPITQEGRTHFGTASYCPPEWIGSAPVDPVRWDAYATGVLMYELLTGRVAFPMPTEGSPGMRILAVMSEKQSLPALDAGPECPEDLRSLVRDLTRCEVEDALCDLDEALRRLRG